MNKIMLTQNKILLHVHMEVSRRIDRWRKVYSNFNPNPSDFFYIYQGVESDQKNLHTKETLSHLVFELLLEDSRCGTLYTEFKFNLLRWMDVGLEVEEIYQALTNGIDKAKEETGIYSSAILCIRRDFQPEIVERLISIVCEMKNSNIVGIDLAGDERKYPFCKDFKHPFNVAKTNGLKITIHAGEFGGPENIWFAIEELGADRIGHGISSLEDPSLIDYLVSKKIMLEISLSSNQWFGVTNKLENHPINSFIEKNIPVSINTDNPVLLNTNLSKEFEIASSVCKISNSSLNRILYDSIIHSFASPYVKKQLLLKVNQDNLSNNQFMPNTTTLGDNLLEISETAKITMESYNKNASGYAAHHFEKNIMKNHLQSFISFLPRYGAILDAGCGPGQDSKFFKSKGYEVIGIDLSQRMIEEANKRVPDVDFIQRNMCENWIEKKSYFIGIWCSAALLHLTLEEAKTALANFYYLLKPDGLIFISFIKGKGEVIKHEERAYGQTNRFFKYYEIDEFKALLIDNHFEILKLNDEERWGSFIARKPKAI